MMAGSRKLNRAAVLGALVVWSGVAGPLLAQTSQGRPATAARRATVNFTDLAQQEKSSPAARGPIKPKAIHRPLSAPHPQETSTTPLNQTESRPASPLADGPQAPTVGPALGASFQGLLDNNRVIPPDTQGAVGPNHVMTTLNSQVRIQNRQGGVLSTVTLDFFWRSLGHAEAFDPKLVYDQQANRWVFVALSDPFSGTSSLMLGVSQTSDPTGNWNLFDVDADTANTLWADYPNLAYNGKWIVATVNMFGVSSPFFGRTQVYAFDKNDLGATGGAAHTVFNDSGFTLVPAVTFDASESNMYLVSEETSSSLRISSISGAVGSETYASNAGTVSSPQSWDFGAATVNSLPQLGTSEGIDADDSRMQICVNRNGSLWATHTVFLPPGSPTHAAVQWWQFRTNGTLIQRGRIEDNSGQVHYAYPSIAVNQNDDAVIGYSRFSSAQYASANYSFRFSADPANTMSGDVVLKAGEAPYRKDFGYGDVRWGDYSATVVDPLNDSDIWTIQEYAASPSGPVDRWGTWWGQLLFGGPPDGILEVGITPVDGTTLLAGTTEKIFVRVTDAQPVTNATVVATINGGASLVFSNNGVAPDAIANDAIYTANLAVPSSTNDLTLSFLITAPGKTNSTNIVTYSVVPLPVNDYFTNATKVPVGGALYLSNNKFATIEPGEPQHAGVTTVAGSLWWNWSPGSTTNVFLDTTGSAIDTVLAVYTGATLGTLHQVAATNDVGSKKQAYLNINVTNGASYRIAVASLNSTSLGSLRLRVTPGGQLDTNAPTVSITSPPSGLYVANNSITVSGTANDPQLNSSGLNQVFISVNDQFPSAASGTTNWSGTAGLREGPNTIKVTAADNAGNVSAPVSVNVTYVVANPVNDLFANATLLSGDSGSASVITTNATKEFNEPNHAGNEGGKSVWWNWQAPADGALFLSTSNSAFDTLLGLYTGGPVANLTTIASNDDAYDGVSFSQINQAVRNGQTYHIALDGFGGSSGSASLMYLFTAIPVFSLTVTSAGNGNVTPPSGDVAANSTVVLTATPSEFYQFDSWTGSFFSTDNPLSVVVNSDINLTAHFRPISFTDDFETGNLLKLTWSTSGNVPWLVQTNTVLAGSFSARSGVIGDNQTSSLSFTTNFGGGTASFYFKVSSEQNFDFLNFYVDGVLQQQWSGEVGWTSFSFPLPGGTHTLEWRYIKDANVSLGLDAAFIDNVNLPFSVGIDASTPAHLQMVRQLDGSLLLQIQGQTNQQYVIQGTTSLTPPVAWQNLSTNIATGGMIQFIDPGTATNPIRFYRAIVP
ncbi:MAG: Ig-like domain-containing protein [Verrucomicrobia bacterium]|nr:Ig-like domain-containing protein [Verrucomicrobiota bacterium]